MTPKITAMKRLDAMPGGETKNAGRERWNVEFDGLGSLDVIVEIPARTNNMKDAAKRTEKVKDLVREAAMDFGNQMMQDHAG